MMPRRYMPSLHELVAFEAVARLQSFTRAAEELALTQSALSKQIGQLEATLGTRLFLRTKRDVRITQEGDAYVSAVRPLLERLEQSTNSILAAPRRKRVLVAAPPALATVWLAPRLPRFAASNPNISVNCVAYSDTAEPAAQSIDIAIATGEGTLRENSKPLFRDDLIVVASPVYRDDNGGLEHYRDIAASALIFNTRRERYWSDWAARAGVRLGDSASYGFDGFLAIIRAAVSGLGVALVPRLLAEQELAGGTLVEVSDICIPAEPYRLIFPDTGRKSDEIDRFCDWLTSHPDVARQRAN